VTADIGMVILRMRYASARANATAAPERYACARWPKKRPPPPRPSAFSRRMAGAGGTPLKTGLQIDGR